MAVLTVSQINRYIAFSLKNDRNLQGIMVKGEISNFVRHFRSGHMYFTLKDSESSVKAVMFASAAARLKFLPEDRMEVIVSGSVSVYERDGAYQLYVNDIVPEGAGKAGAALEQLRKKLAKEGIFDSAHKRPLPEMPAKIGVVTSLCGAAVRDIINVLTRRYPIGEIYAVNALVQGDEAPDSICRGIMKAESAGCDVVIVGRGGGSSEDLSAFNTEKVAYGIYNCKVPVISAVGHEVDFTIADLAADMRAPTPSAAAELSAPSVESLSERIDSLEKRLEKSALSSLNRAEDKLNTLNSLLSAQSPENRLRISKEKVDSLEKRNRNAFERLIMEYDSKLTEKIAKIESLSPLKVLARGYSIVYSDDKIVKRSETIECGDVVKIRLGSGGLNAKVIEKWW